MNSAEHWTYLNRVGSLPGVETYEINESILEKIAYRENPDGLLTIAKNPNIDLRDLDAANVSLVLVADRTEKPSNLGTMIRSADAVNCDLVLVSDAVIDLFNPNVIRASIGTIFCVPVVATSGNKVRHWFSENKIQVVTASPAASHDYTQFDFKARSAIVVGNESLGLDDAWFDAAASNVCLPVLGSGDSINAAQCATVLLFEALRQRRSA